MEDSGESMLNALFKIERTQLFLVVSELRPPTRLMEEINRHGKHLEYWKILNTLLNFGFLQKVLHISGCL